MDWLPWAPLVAILCHIFEEFVWPGGFLDWYRSYRKDTSRVTARMLVVVNALLLIACADYAYNAEAQWGATCLLGVCALLCTNGLWHVYASVKSHTVSPGVFTGILLYLPMTVLIFEIFLRSRRTSLVGAAGAFLIGGSYHLWSALYHRSRSQSQATD